MTLEIVMRQREYNSDRNYIAVANAARIDSNEFVIFIYGIIFYTKLPG